MKYTIKKFLRPGWLVNFNKFNKIAASFFIGAIFFLLIFAYLIFGQFNSTIIVFCLVIVSLSIFFKIAAKYLLKAKNISIKSDHLIIELVGLKIKIRFKDIIEVGIITPFHLPPKIMAIYDFDESDRVIYIKRKTNWLLRFAFVENQTRYFLLNDPENFIASLKEKTKDIEFIEKDFTKKAVLANKEGLGTKRVIGVLTFIIVPIVISILFIPKIQLKFNSIFSKVYQVKGNSYYKNNNFKAAIINYNKAVDFNPENAEIYNQLSYVYHKLEDYDKAIQLGLKAIMIDSKLVEAYQNLAVIYRKQQWYELSIETCKKIISLDAYSFSAYSQMGLSYEKLEKYEEALNSHKQALIKNPNHYFSNFRLALIYIKRGENELAMKEYNVLKKSSSSMAKYLEKKLFDK